MSKSLKLKALEAKVNSDKLNALATLDIYLFNSVGVGEHPQVMEEMDKQLSIVADANGKLEVLKNLEETLKNIY